MRVTIPWLLLSACCAAPLAAQEPVAKPPPDPAALLEAAKAKAAKANKRILVAFLGATCERSASLAAALDGDAALKRCCLYEFEVVRADAQKDSELAKRLCVDPKAGTPALLVLDRAGQPIAALAPESYADGTKVVTEKLIEALKPHQATPLDADTVLADALAKAKASERRVLVHLGAPW